MITLMLTFFACEDKSRQAESIIYGDQPAVEEQSYSDTTSTTVQKEENKHKEKHFLPVNSPSSISSTSHKSSGHDNMRGFDPASEDDMEDNGMSRYMENNDDEGWD